MWDRQMRQRHRRVKRQGSKAAGSAKHCNLRLWLHPTADRSRDRNPDNRRNRRGVHDCPNDPGGIRRDPSPRGLPHPLCPRLQRRNQPCTRQLEERPDTIGVSFDFPLLSVSGLQSPSGGGRGTHLSCNNFPHPRAGRHGGFTPLFPATRPTVTPHFLLSFCPKLREQCRRRPITPID